MARRPTKRCLPPPGLQERCCGASDCNRRKCNWPYVPSSRPSHRSSRTTPSASMIRIPTATLANPKSDAALGGAPGPKLPAQIKTNNQHTKLDKAMPVRGTPQ